VENSPTASQARDGGHLPRSFPCFGGSLRRGYRLADFMSGPSRRALHPLLLERAYWRNRLQQMNLAQPSVLLIPRPELSTLSVEVDEFRLRTHDGIRLFGLRAQSRLPLEHQEVMVRMVGPCESPDLDREAMSRGMTEFVFQEPAGRRLEDRVMDVLRMCQVAAAQEGRSTRDVRLVCSEETPDEFLIVTQLLADEIDLAASGAERCEDETLPFPS